MDINGKIISGIFTFLCAAIACAATTQKREIEFTAYIDGSYNYLERSRYFTSDYPNRVNDLAENGVRLQQLYLRGKSLPDHGFGAEFEVIAGLDAYTLFQFGWNSNVFQIQNIGLVVPEAFLQYNFGDATLQAGEFQALSGYESYVYLLDTNFSHGILYAYAVAGSHDGLRWVKNITDQWKLTLGVVNGWNSLHEAAQMQALECGATYSVTDVTSFTVNGYYGSQYLAENIFTGPTSTRGLVDIYGSHQVTEQLELAYEASYGFQPKAALPFAVIGRATWAGLAAFINYDFNDKWRTSLRSEILNDSSGYRTGVRQSWKEVTLTLGYKPIKHLEVMLETRRDFSNVNAFVNKGGAGTANNQQSFALNFLYQFV